MNFYLYPNNIYNGDFETSDTTSWLQYDANSADGSFLVNTSEVEYGAYCGRYVVDSIGPGIEDVQLKYRFEDIKNNEPYILNYRAKAWTTKKISVYVEEAGGNYTGHLVASPASLTSEWQQFAHVFSGQEDNEVGQILWHCGSDYTDWYIDQLRLIHALEVYPNDDYENNIIKLESTDRTETGKQYRYKFGQYNQIKFSVDYMSSSLALIVNSWYESNTDLFFAVMSSNNYTEIYSVHITGDDRPFRSYTAPYVNKFSGKITLESY